MPQRSRNPSFLKKLFGSSSASRSYNTSSNNTTTEAPKPLVECSSQRKDDIAGWMRSLRAKVVGALKEDDRRQQEIDFDLLVARQRREEEELRESQPIHSDAFEQLGQILRTNDQSVTSDVTMNGTARDMSTHTAATTVNGTIIGKLPKKRSMENLEGLPSEKRFKRNVENGVDPALTLQEEDIDELAARQVAAAAIVAATTSELNENDESFTSYYSAYPETDGFDNEISAGVQSDHSAGHFSIEALRREEDELDMLEPEQVEEQEEHEELEAKRREAEQENEEEAEEEEEEEEEGEEEEEEEEGEEEGEEEELEEEEEFEAPPERISIYGSDKQAMAVDPSLQGFYFQTKVAEGDKLAASTTRPYEQDSDVIEILSDSEEEKSASPLLVQSDHHEDIEDSNYSYNYEEGVSDEGGGNESGLESDFGENDEEMSIESEESPVATENLAAQALQAFAQVDQQHNFYYSHAEQGDLFVDRAVDPQLVAKDIEESSRESEQEETKEEEQHAEMEEEELKDDKMFRISADGTEAMDFLMHGSDKEPEQQKFKGAVPYVTAEPVIEEPDSRLPSVEPLDTDMSEYITVLEAADYTAGSLDEIQVSNVLVEEDGEISSIPQGEVSPEVNMLRFENPFVDKEKSWASKTRPYFVQPTLQEKSMFYNFGEPRVLNGYGDSDDHSMSYRSFGDTKSLMDSKVENADELVEYAKSVFENSELFSGVRKKKSITVEEELTKRKKPKDEFNFLELADETVQLFSHSALFGGRKDVVETLEPHTESEDKDENTEPVAEDTDETRTETLIEGNAESLTKHLIENKEDSEMLEEELENEDSAEDALESLLAKDDEALLQALQQREKTQEKARIMEADRNATSSTESTNKHKRPETSPNVSKRTRSTKPAQPRTQEVIKPVLETPSEPEPNSAVPIRSSPRKRAQSSKTTKSVVAELGPDLKASGPDVESPASKTVSPSKPKKAGQMPSPAKKKGQFTTATPAKPKRKRHITELEELEESQTEPIPRTRTLRSGKTYDEANSATNTDSDSGLPSAIADSKVSPRKKSKKEPAKRSPSKSSSSRQKLESSPPSEEQLPEGRATNANISESQENAEHAIRLPMETTPKQQKRGRKEKKQSSSSSSPSIKKRLRNRRVNLNK